MKQYDLIIIGAGPGGYPGALAAASYGLKTAVVEERELGGTCLNRGCIPTKTLLHTTEMLRELKEETAAGVLAGEMTCDAAALFARKEEVTGKLRDGVADLLKRAKVDVLTGHGKILGPGLVEVTSEEGLRVYEAEHILIATGSVPAKIPVPGSDLPGVVTSDDLLSGVVPKSLTIVGGGVIGVELASVYHELGCEVTILEMLPKILPNMDKEISQNLTQILKRRGIGVNTGAALKEITQTEEGLTCRYEQKGKELSVTSEKVLIATGRRANLAGLFAEDLGVEVNRGVVVNEHFETSVPGIYAIGDAVAGNIQLAHVATAQAKAVVAYLAGQTPQVRLDLVPSCIYTSPEIACVGMTEEEAKEAGLAAKSKKALLHGNAKTIITRQDRSFIKVVYEEESHRVLGAQLMMGRASDLINEYTEAVANGLTMEQMASLIRPHPTFCEAADDAFAL